MENGGGTFETSVTTYNTTRRNNPEDQNELFHSREDCKCRNVIHVRLRRMTLFWVNVQSVQFEVQYWSEMFPLQLFIFIACWYVESTSSIFSFDL
jgi:hypothetical protein